MSRSEPTAAGRGHGIALSGVTKSFPGNPRPAVDDVSLDIAPGEFVTFLGPSGSGKTTLLSVMAGFTALSSGSICIDGRDVSTLKPHRRDLGVVFQHYALFPHLTVAQNIAYPLQQRKMSKGEIDRRVRDALALVYLDGLGQRLPRQLSGGQQQRVALARAVVYDPRALLLDEPLGALDKRLRGELQREIARMHRELQMTFIFVTHDQEEALSLSDRIVVLNEGKVEQVGTPHELYDQPATLFVGEFLGDSNAFAGTLDRDAGRLDCGDFVVRVPPQQAAGAAAHSVALVRPERVVLWGESSQVPAGHNSHPAVLTEVTYVGSHLRIGLDFGGGAAGSAMVMVGEPVPATPGDSVVVSWDPRHQSVVADPSPSPVILQNWSGQVRSPAAGTPPDHEGEETARPLLQDHGRGGSQ